MKINPTEDGGRIIAGDTPYGSWRIVVSPKGEITRESTFSFDEQNIKQQAYESETKVSTGEKAARLVRSIARDPVGMVRAASPAQVRQRLEVCAGCEWLDPKTIGCKICGCSFRQKLTRASNSCPIHEWELAEGRTLTEKQQKERDNELEKAQEKYYGASQSAT